MNEMKTKGAEFIIVNLHWGDEYFTHRIIPLDGEGTTEIPIQVTSGESSAAASLQRTEEVLGKGKIGTFEF